MFVLASRLSSAPYPALPQQGFEGGLTDAVALGEHMCWSTGCETRDDHGQVLRTEPVAHTAWLREWRAGELSWEQWLITLGYIVTFEQVGAQSGVQGESSHPERH